MYLHLWVPYHNRYLVRYTIFPLVRSKSSPPRTNCLTRPPPVIDKKKKKTIPWWSSSCIERHALSCRCQPTPTQPIYNKGQGVTRQRGFPVSILTISYPTVTKTKPKKLKKKRHFLDLHRNHSALFFFRFGLSSCVVPFSLFPALTLSFLYGNNASRAHVDDRNPPVPKDAG